MNIVDFFDPSEKPNELVPVETKNELQEQVHSQHNIKNTFEKLEKDLHKSSQVINDLLDIGMRDIKNLSSLAEESENPRAYEIVSGMISSIKDTAESLVNLHMKKAQIENLINSGVVGKTTSITEIGNVTNAVFVGSVADALKQIKHAEIETESTLDKIEIPTKPYQEIVIEAGEAELEENE